MDEELSELESGAVLRDHILDMINVCHQDLMAQSSLQEPQQQAIVSTGTEWSPDTTLLPTPSESSIPLRLSLYDNAALDELQRLARQQGDNAATQSKSDDSMATDRARSFLKMAARPLVLATMVLVVAIVIALAYAVITGVGLDRSRTKQGHLARSSNDTDTSLG